jgi:hypothetical protein
MSRDSIVEEIKAERERQFCKEGWTPSHDEQHTEGELAWAAACYAAPSGDIHRFEPACDGNPYQRYLKAWPWDAEYDKRWKHNRKRQLIISAALIIAELERLERLETIPTMK